MYLLPHYIDKKSTKIRLKCTIAQKHVCLPKLLQSKQFTHSLSMPVVQNIICWNLECLHTLIREYKVGIKRRKQHNFKRKCLCMILLYSFSFSKTPILYQHIRTIFTSSCSYFTRKLQYLVLSAICFTEDLRNRKHVLELFSAHQARKVIV